MAKQIEIFSPYDPVIQNILQNSKTEYKIRYVDVTDKKTGEVFRLYINKKEEKKLFNDPDKYMEGYFKKHSELATRNKKDLSRMLA